MTAKLKKYISYEVTCEKHNVLFRWNQEYCDMLFLEALSAGGWGYEFQKETVFYCPECLKESGLSCGRVDIRGTIK